MRVSFCDVVTNGKNPRRTGNVCVEADGPYEKVGKDKKTVSG